MQIEGQITDIVYRNEVNSYTVAEFLTNENEEITVVGYLPFIGKGDNLRLSGEIIEHPEYGEQLKIKTFEKIMPETPEALEQYLANGKFKGIGPATAKKIVNTFGVDTINVIKLEPEKLTQIKGITKEKAIEIAEEFMNNWEVWQIVGYLDQYDIGPQSAERVYKRLGDNAIDQIRKNPYLLIDVVNKVSFEKIDKIALEMGFDIDNYQRIRSGIKYGLEKIALNGNSTVLYQNLINYVKDLLKVSKEAIEETIINMKAKEEIIIEERNNKEEWIYLQPYYMAEKNIAEKIIAINEADNVKKIRGFKKELEQIEESLDVVLSEKQKEAVEAINKNNVVVITGGPGTGKTTIIKTIIEIYKKQGKKPVLCAPTGRAAKRMTELTGEEAKTLHRLLELSGIMEDMDLNEEIEISPIDGDIIIVDEASMIDMFLMNYLMKALYKGTKLVLVGDINQLPSVGPGSVLKDIINSNKIMTITLTQIFRQAAKSRIIVNAHRVNEGKYFITGKEIEEKEKIEKEKLLEDFFFINEQNQINELNTLISLCNGRLKNYGDYDFFDNIQVITPTKKGNLGTKELNKIMQEKLNSHTENKRERKYGDVIYREQDRVMQIKNNYNIMWEREADNSFGKELGNGIFNGELGRIKQIDEESKSIMIKYDDGKEAIYEPTELDQIEHAYAITVHKSQGSEFDVVILVLSNSSPMLLTRNLIYTAITRAKKMLIILGPSQVANYMIDNNTSKIRNTGLEYKLEQINNII